MTTKQPIDWLRETLADYRLEPVAVFRHSGSHKWPLRADSNEDLESALRAGGHFLPLPKEPAALANVLEDSILTFLQGRASSSAGVAMKRGTERGYPDLELSGDAFAAGFFAVDVKVARRGTATQTQSRITLFTGNTYFMYPQLQWPGTFRPFQNYRAHLDILAIYTLNEATEQRVEDLELLVQESWRIASKQRSSTTREYIGAVTSISNLRAGKGDFASEKEFLTFWRKFEFKVGKAVQNQLKKLLAEKSGPAE